MNEKKYVVCVVILIIVSLCLIFSSVLNIHLGTKLKESSNLLVYCRSLQPDCWDGCLYAEWILYGKGNLVTSSELYNNCTDACYLDDEYFEVDEGVE
jgi:hypothetical protein